MNENDFEVCPPGTLAKLKKLEDERLAMLERLKELEAFKSDVILQRVVKALKND